jgi:membrane protein YqaA with SNARE-associated domain
VEINPAYHEVFNDAFFSNFILTYKKEIGFPLLIHFDKYDNYIGLIYGVLGSMLGLGLTFLFFYFCAQIFKDFLHKSASYEPFKDFLNKFKIIFLSLVAFPGASIIAPFFAGLVRMNIFKFFLICLIYRILFYLTILKYPDIYW